MTLRVPLTIAKDEWRYWRRTRLGLVAVIAAMLLLGASLVSTTMRIDHERTSRENFQSTATQYFEGQPARHPHRVIHYGHYVFRIPAPLSIIDPGVDAYAGTAMFLEGHSQNSAAFPPRYAAAQAGPFAELSPAFTYQVLLPLLLIVLGFAAMSREREARTDYLLYAASVTSAQIWLGKTLALAGAALVSLLPMAIGLAVAVAAGASALVAIYMLLGYAVYLVAWALLIVAASVWAGTASSSFSWLLACWIALCVILPPLAGSAAQTVAPMDGKIATDFAVKRALRGTDDGHNVNDPSFAQLRAQLLEQYDVEDVADLPINFRGVVSKRAEARQSEVLNAFAEEKLAGELAQSRVAHWLGLLSPTLALKNFSVTIAGTDLRQYHAFLRDAESVRYDFVQKLNTLHAETLAYADDMQRSNNPEAEQRTRLNPANWRMLEEVSSQPRPAWIRVAQSLPHLAIILVWCGLLAWLGMRGMRRSVHGGV